MGIISQTINTNSFVQYWISKFHNQINEYRTPILGCGTSPLGRQIYRCQLCGERAYNLEEIKQKGGEIVQKEGSNTQN